MADAVLYHHEPSPRLEASHPLVRIVRLAHLLSCHEADDPGMAWRHGPVRARRGRAGPGARSRCAPGAPVGRPAGHRPGLAPTRSRPRPRWPRPRPTRCSSAWPTKCATWCW
ncbi:hypothetical protein LP420_23820 [Massilia sp. B-10]|nr:hypothetical protein LP420_23820 [Massilia sp. B-10]